MGGNSKSLSSLGDLLRAKGFEELEQPEPVVDDPGPAKVTFDPKVVLRRERKGRGGKTVTTVRGVNGDPQAVKDLVKTLKRQLGCGGRVDGELLVFQGDCGEALARCLNDCGAGQIRIS